MKQINDINVLLKINGVGATHYRLSIDSDISLVNWTQINDDYTIPFTLPNIYGTYSISFLN